MKLRRTRLVLGLAVVVAIAATAIGSSAASGSTQTRPAVAAKKTPPKKKPAKKINVKKNLANLYTAAKAEGTVIWEVGGVPSTFQPIADAFEQHYPGINVQIINIQGTQVPGRIITEGTQASFDVATSDLVNLEPVIARKLIATPNWANLGVPSSKIVFKGQLLYAYDFVLGWIYNTQKLQPNQLPTTWNELLSPQWKGQALLNQQGAEGFEGMFLDGTWKLPQYKSYLASFAQQGWPGLTAGASIIQAVAAGQDLIGVTAVVQLPTFIKKGAQLALLPVGPIVARPQGPAVLKYAPHPYAARLLSAWLVSPAAEAVWKSALGLGPSEPCSADELANLICQAHLQVAHVDTLGKAVNYHALETINRKALGF